MGGFENVKRSDEFEEGVDFFGFSGIVFKEVYISDCLIGLGGWVI